ncbi:penicillin-binding protein 2 [Candidatus Parcubacteria bacterium]|nr:penicillin-binding protein 2 [Candidatus Parcubacteria bacterium]
MKDSKTRIRIISVAVLAFGAMLATKLYFVQIVSGEVFSEKADRQYTRPVGGVFNRGSIFFQAKDGTLMAAASLKTGYTVAINPKLLKDTEAAYTALSSIIALDRDSFLAKAAKVDDPYEEIARRLDPDMAAKITNLDISGVNVYKEKWRFYPGETLASQVIGFVGYNDDMLGGQYGLENSFETVLKRDDENLYVNFFAEVFSDLHKTLTDTGTTEGDITATIEPHVQSFVEKQLQEIDRKFNPKLSGAIVIDPKTGEIYSMAATPSFNPNSFQTEKDANVFINPLVQSVYEMGSIIKPLTMAAGLDAGVITAKSTYNDKGYLDLDGKTIYNFDKVGRGTVDMQQVLNQSLNTGVAYVAKQLGSKQFAQYMLNYGFGSKTGIDLPNESKGLVENLKSRREVERATASFGQGIAMSPISVTRALSALANGGKLVTPHVIKKIDYKVGFSKIPTYPEPVQVIKPETSKEISRMLTEVVDVALLEGKVKMDRYSIAAKTGTAQIAHAGKYYDDRFLHSFFGYFPSTDPRFLVFLYTVEPHGVEYAAHTLTEPFVNITKFLINYYEIPPDR